LKLNGKHISVCVCVCVLVGGWRG